MDPWKTFPVNKHKVLIDVNPILATETKECIAIEKENLKLDFEWLEKEFYVGIHNWGR